MPKTHLELIDSSKPNLYRAAALDLENFNLKNLDLTDHSQRFYQRSLIEKAIAEYNLISYSIGTFDNHDDPNVVDLAKVTHKIIDVKLVGNDVVVDIEILNTPSGKIVPYLLKNMVDLYLSLNILVHHEDMAFPVKLEIVGINVISSVDNL